MEKEIRLGPEPLGWGLLVDRFDRAHA
jgi:hypothetical protein